MLLHLRSYLRHVLLNLNEVHALKHLLPDLSVVYGLHRLLEAFFVHLFLKKTFEECEGLEGALGTGVGLVVLLDGAEFTCDFEVGYVGNH